MDRETASLEVGFGCRQGGGDPRFAQEAKVLAKVAHPNIVPVYNLGPDSQGRPFYSMKLVKGRSLQNDLIRENAARLDIVMF